MPQSRAKLDSNLQQFETALAATDKQVSNELAPLKGKGYFVFMTPTVTLKTLRFDLAGALYRQP